MPKSGNVGSRAKKRKPKKNIVTFPQPVQDVSRSSFAPAPPQESSTALISPAEARVFRALHKLGISQKTWEESPEITPIIWRTMGNQKQAVDMLRFSDDHDCKKFLKVYRELTKDEQERLPLEIPCLAAGVSPSHILGQIILNARDVSRMESALVLVTKNAEVLSSTAAFGIALPNNVRDREMILKATKTLPTPQGGGINVFVGSGPEDNLGPEVSPEDSNMESDVFHYDTKTIDGWGDNRRRLMDSEKRK